MVFEYRIDFTPKTINHATLQAAFQTAFPTIEGLNSSGGNGFVGFTSTVQLSQGNLDTLSGIIVAHDPALTAAQQTDADLVNAGITAKAARDDLRRALYNGTAAGTVYAAMKAYIDGNPKLLQIITQDIALHNAVFGWTVSAGSNATAAAQRQYIVIARQTLALL